MTDTTFTANSDAGTNGIDWKRLFTSFSGRIDRKAFWIGFGVMAAVSMAVQFVLFSVVNASDFEVASIVATVPFIYPALAVYAKRCHDRGKSAWWLLMLIVPIVGFVWLVFELGTQPSVDTDMHEDAVAASA